MPATTVTRRTIVKTLLALGAGSVLSPYIAAFAEDGKKISLPAWDEKPSLETFRALSTLVTLHDDLDEDACADMHKVFLDEPWGAEHIVRLYRKIRQALEKGVTREKSPGMKDADWKLDDAEKWFAEHLLTTWYLGIYYHQERPTRRITYENALMFAAIEGVLPIPLIEPVGFGNWSEPPPGAESEEQ